MINFSKRIGALGQRRNLGLALVLGGIFGAFAALSLAEFGYDGGLPLDLYLLMTATLIVSAGAFFQLHLYNRQQEQKLELERKENAVMRMALDTHAIVSVTDSQGRIIDVNSRFTELTGYERNEIIGRTPRFLHESEEGTQTFHMIRAALDQGRTWHGEHCSITKTGEKRWFEVTVVPMMSQRRELVKAISVRTDVTEQRAAEADRQMSAILDNMQDEVFIYRARDLRMHYMNEAACARFGWKTADVKSKTMTDIRGDFDEARFRRHLAPLFSGSVTTTYLQGQHSGDPVEVATSLFEAVDGEKLLISVLRDIREREALARAKLSSVSVVSHELRTPLTAISGAIKMLKGRFSDEYSKQVGGIVDIAERNCERLLFIVNDILDLEKIEAGKMSFDKKPLAIDALASEAISSLQPYASELGVRLSLETQVEDAMVEADASRMMQVMSNLLSNAAKYSSEGDVVNVAVTATEGGWRVAVKDHGPGIGPEDQAKLFNTFAQINAADGKKRLGTGLGLAITRRILDNHGARIGVDSVVGKGSTFYFEIPKYVENAEAETVIAA